MICRRAQLKSRLSRLAWLLLLCAACSHKLPPYKYKAEPDPRSKPYVLGPSDQLHITVWRNPNLTTTATLRPDGTITMPLIGDLNAAGRTTDQLRGEIKRRLQAYVVGATVTVAVTQVNSYRFTVAGHVARPGLFTARSFVTVGEAVAMAGGPTRFARPERTIIVRQPGHYKKGRSRRIPVDYPSVAAGRKLRQNIVILPGDTVFVP